MAETLSDFLRLFPDDKACITYLMQLRHPSPICPVCQRKNAYHLSNTRSSFTCTCGSHHIYPANGTLAASSPIIHKYFQAIWLVWKRGKILRGKDIQEQLDVAPVSAWRIRYRINRVGEPRKDETLGAYLDRLFTG